MSFRLLLFAVLSLGLIGPQARAEEETPEWEVPTADLGPTTTLEWTVDNATWVSVDVSPDGTTLVFDILGDLYTLPIEGGAASLLRGGRAYEVQPRWSPDGEWISFTSDAGGGDNLWVMRADGSEARQVTDESFRLLNNAVWTPDGRALVARKHFTSRRSLGAGEMWLYDVQAGGGGVQLTEKPNDQKDVGEPEISPDGRHLYYSLDATPGSTFQYNKDPNGTIYEIRRLDLTTGETETILSEPGGSVRPICSPDGKLLAYVRRVRLKSVLMVMDLETGDSRALYDGLSLDSQETWSIFGVYPTFSFTPDSGSIVVWAKGGLVRVDVASGDATPIPFTADLSHEVVDAVRFAPEIGQDEMDVRVLRWPRVSPDGERVVFQALGSLWVRDLEGGEPKRLTDSDDFEYHPAWSPDGKTIVYTTWNDVAGGRVRTVSAGGGRSRVVVERPGHYVEPAFSSDGKRIVYRRVGGDFYRGSRFTLDTGVWIVDAKGGEPRLVTESGSRPRFTDGDQRLLLMEFGDTKTLYSVDLLGGDRRDLVTSDRARELELSPDGEWIAFEELWEVYVAPRPALGRALAVGPKMANLPVRKVSEVGGEFLHWTRDGELTFGLGPDLFRVDVAAAFAPAAADEAEDEESDEDTEAEPLAETIPLGFAHPAEVPASDVALTNATILTMGDAGVIEGGTVLVRGNRIVAVGRDVEVGDATVMDMEGRVLAPGFVDVHAHLWSSNNDMQAQSNWGYLANLAFGVTSTHDPSNNTRMVFSSHELVRAGRTLGPRIYSTGTILYGAEGDFKAVIDTREDARRHLQRLQAYGAFTAKSYNQPRRDQRQWVIREARDLGMMVVPEGGSMYGHNMSMILDGHTTIEHAIPLAPLYDDALELFARSGTSYTPTMTVGYGGLWGENHWYQKTNVWENERLLRFVPRSVVDPRSRRRTMVPEGEFWHRRLATTAAEIVRRGGNAEVGAHGQMQGIGVHWEMWMFAQGGLTPLEVLEVGTLRGARSLGLDHAIGSVEVGKLADLVVFEADPREDIRNTEHIRYVMANGRLLEAMTMDELHPAPGPRPQGPPLNTIPRDMWGRGCVHP